MSEYDASIKRQYGYSDLGDRLLKALQQAGKNIDHLTHEDLSPFDEFHPGGIIETRSLARLADLKPEMHVLDAGSGMGGPARALAAEFGCCVTGLDLTEEYCNVAGMLSARAGFSKEQVDFRCGNVLEMPFEDHTFDAAVTQFVGMNIEAKAQWYAEFKRVLKPKGTLAIYEAMAGSQPNIHYPVFWANQPEISFLRTPEEIRTMLEAQGFKVLVWNDIGDTAKKWFQGMVDRIKSDGQQQMGFNAFVREHLPEKAENLLRNLNENRVAVIQAVLQSA